VARKKGQIIVVGSALSVVAFMGYSTYASTKHALRGLADTLRNELVGFGITVHIAYPPDT
jgi:3-dehydrosphinganine reductase